MERNKFRMAPAYSGGPVRFPFWGQTIFDISGMHYAPPLPALREHLRDRTVGTITQIARQGQTLHAEGHFSEVTQDGKEVAALAREGFPWQASIAIWPEEIEEIEAGVTVSVNGQPFKGPGVVVRRAHLRELSFVVLGLDSDTVSLPLAASASPGGQGGAAPENFFQAVKAMLGRGLPVRAAIRAAAKAWPEIFQAHLDEIGHPGGYEDLDLGPPPSCPFEAKVREFMAAGKTRGQAIREIARDFPGLRESYLAGINE